MSYECFPAVATNGLGLGEEGELKVQMFNKPQMLIEVQMFNLALLPLFRQTLPMFAFIIFIGFKKDN